MHIMGYDFYQNKSCEYFPCHETNKTICFSCQFCFCPLYYIPDCGGNWTLFNGMKDCGKCLLPHKDYDYVVTKIMQYNKSIK